MQGIEEKTNNASLTADDRPMAFQQTVLRTPAVETANAPAVLNNAAYERNTVETSIDDALRKEVKEAADNSQEKLDTIDVKPNTEVVYIKDGKNVWKDKQEPWASSFAGRLAIRSFTRGVLGALFFAAGSHLATTRMEGYDPNAALFKKKTDTGDVSGQKNNVQRIAKLFDLLDDKLIRRVTKTTDIKRFGHSSVADKSRSLGEDAVMGNLGFAMATVGDALGGKLIAIMDPHTKASWRMEDGSISIPAFAKSIVTSTANIFMAQMADWAVAVPYAYQKQWQRNIINRFSPGFAEDSLSGRNGSTFKLDKDGGIKGTYAWESFLDFQGRFTMYNIGTMMYRDTLNASRKFIDHIQHPEKYKNTAATQPAGAGMYNQSHNSLYNAARYMATTLTKGLLIMTPTVPLFSAVRILQNKAQWRDRKPHSAAFFPTTPSKEHPLPYKEIDLFDAGFDKENIKSANINGVIIDEKVFKEYGYGSDFKPYGKQTVKTGLDAIANQTGKASAAFATGAVNISDTARKKGIWGFKRSHDAKYFGKSFSDAAFAYTPYIFAKAELMDRWNTGRMNLALDALFDGITSFNKTKVKDGFQAFKLALKYDPGDVRGSHPETIPTGYDPDKGYIVVKLKDANTGIKEEKQSLQQQAVRVNASASNEEKQILDGNDGENALSNAVPDSLKDLQKTPQNADAMLASVEDNARVKTSSAEGKYSANLKPRTPASHASKENAGKSWGDRHQETVASEAYTPMMAGR